MPKRLIYRTWLAENTGPLEPKPVHRATGPLLISLSDLSANALSTEDLSEPDQHTANQRALRELIEKALDRLTAPEREFIEQFYFRGVGCKELARRSGRSYHNLVSLHEHALRRLRKELAGPARRLFGVSLPSHPTCIICGSGHRDRIDQLLAQRDRTQPWRPTIRRIKRECGLAIKSPQTLISHEKYH